MTIKETQQALECWTFRPTWYTSHAIDTEAMDEAISNIQALGFTPSRDELIEAIYENVKNIPAILDTPADLRKAAQEFAAKIYARL